MQAASLFLYNICINKQPLKNLSFSYACLGAKEIQLASAATGPLNNVHMPHVCPLAGGTYNWQRSQCLAGSVDFSTYCTACLLFTSPSATPATSLQWPGSATIDLGGAAALPGASLSLPEAQLPINTVPPTSMPAAPRHFIKKSFLETCFFIMQSL